MTVGNEMKNYVLSALLFVAYSTFARAESHAMEMPAAVELIAGGSEPDGRFHPRNFAKRTRRGRPFWISLIMVRWMTA